MSATIKIPVSIFTFPFKAIFVLLTSLLGIALLASGVGALVAALSGGFSKRYEALGHRGVSFNNWGGHSTTWQVKMTPGWAARLFGFGSKSIFVYSVSTEHKMLWFDNEGQPVPPALRSAVEFYKFIGKKN